MKIYEAEVAPSGATRICFSTSYEEIDIIHGLCLTALRSIPETEENKVQISRIRNIVKGLGVYTGRAKESKLKTSDFPCPKCKRMLRNEKAIMNHLIDVHGHKIVEGEE